MGDVIEIPKGARDQVLVFALDMPVEQAKFLRDENGAPLVQNRTLTCFTNEEEQEVGLDEVMPFLLATRLAELGATLDLGDKFVSHVVADGRLITGQNPQSSQSVADAMVEALYRE